MNNTEPTLRLDEKWLPPTVMTLAWPVVLQSAVASIFALFIIAFIGRLGPAAITAISLSEAIVALPTILLTGITVAVTAIGARLIGAGEYEQANVIIRQSMLIAFILGLLSAVVLWFSADTLLLIFQARPEVVELGRDYIRVVALAMIPWFLGASGGAILYALGDTKKPMIVSIIMEGMAVSLSYALITGFWLAPELGVLGVGITRAVCAAIGALIVLSLVVKGKGAVKYDLHHALLFDWPEIRRILRVGLPAFGEQLATQGAYNTYMIIISSMGTTIFAGHALAMRVLGFTYVPLNGMATAAAILIGQSLGARKPDLAKKGGYLSLRYCVIVMSCIGVITFLLARQLIGILSDDPEVVRIGVLGLQMWALAMPVVAATLTLASGLRGAGDTRGVFILNTAGMWIVRVGIGALMVFVFALDIVGAWGSGMLDQGVRAILMWRRFARGRWQRTEL
ncbi:MATE family efflux transporter [Candidatus Acetothermia bacterium]|nr:MATE family efflux transporter [Candidatus Acetothermia bacterium]